jgi:hypothetical protein
MRSIRILVTISLIGMFLLSVFTMAYAFGMQRSAVESVRERDALISQFIDQQPNDQRPGWLALTSQLARAPQIDYGGILFPIVAASLLGIIGLLGLRRLGSLQLQVTPREGPKISLKKPDEAQCYRDLLSSPLDPIGDLHRWRLQVEVGERELGDGPSYVKALEEYLREHCSISLLGRYGEQVSFDPRLYKPLSAELRQGMSAKIVAPGWKWRETILRYPEVTTYGQPQ